jgi:hypothetical protein
VVGGLVVSALVAGVVYHYYKKPNKNNIANPVQNTSDMRVLNLASLVHQDGPPTATMPINQTSVEVCL